MGVAPVCRYAGLLCALCEDRFYMKSDNSCQPCGGVHVSDVVWLYLARAFLLLAIVFVALYVVVKYKGCVSLPPPRPLLSLSLSSAVL